MDPPDLAALVLSPKGAFNRTPPRPNSPALAGNNNVATPAGSCRTPVDATPGPAALQLDMSIGSAVSALVHHLVQPLAVHYPHTTLMSLRKQLSSVLTAAYTPLWNESNPHSGSGSRSLISDHLLGLPAILVKAAGTEIDPRVWAKAIASGRRRKPENDDEEREWEVWCDPGMVVWRWGGWSWDEAEFDPIKRSRESYQVIWQAAPTAAPEVTSPLATTTPLRPSKAIPIRAPSLLAMAAPATPSPAPSPGPGAALAAAAAEMATSPTSMTTPSAPSLLPAAEFSPLQPLSALSALGHGRPGSIDFRSHSRNGSRSVSQPLPYAHLQPQPQVFRAAHKGTESTSSHSSDTSDTNSNSHTQLLTPASRPGSADLFPEDKRRASRECTPEMDERKGSESAPSTPLNATSAANATVTPYDGGNVTVLGGGTKLGGSRPLSSVSSRGDRTRSPSVSIASRALATAVGPNSNGGGGGNAGAQPASPRKARTRRRIIPTHIGYFGQPGVGAPMMGAFGMQPIKTGQPGGYWAAGAGSGGGAPVGVGVGVAPPPVGGLGMAAQIGVPMGVKRA